MGVNSVLCRWIFGPVIFDEKSEELLVDGTRATIKPRERKLLSVFLHANGKRLSREELIHEAWPPDSDVGTNAVDKAVSRLRKALGANESRISAEWGHGYSFDVHGVECQAVGPAPQGKPLLKSGDTVPHAGGFTLVGPPLARPKGGEIWLARGPDGEARVFKFAHDSKRIALLIREVMIYRFLQKQLPEERRQGILRMLAENLRQPRYCFLATEHGGQNLADWAEESTRLKTLPFPQRLQLALQVAAAVGAVHSAGVVHGNLQPRNILIAPASDTWHIRLTDFSSGQLLDVAALERHGLSSAGLKRQEPAAPDDSANSSCYLAPERRNGAEPTPRSDVYSLGYLLYQLLAGDLEKKLEIGWERDIEDPLLQADIIAATERDPNLRISRVDELVRRLSTLDQRRREEKTRNARKLARVETTRWGAIVGAVLAAVVALLTYQQLRLAWHVARAEHTRSEQRLAVAKELLGRGNPMNGSDSIHTTLLDAQHEAEKDIGTRLADDPDAQADTLLTLAHTFFGRSAYADAERLQRSAIQILTRARGPADARTLTARYFLTYILDQRGRHEDASTLLEGADRDAAPLLKIASEFSLHALLTRATHHLLLMQPVQTLHWFEEAEAVRLKVAPDDLTLLHRVHGGLAWSYVRMERSQEALQLTQGLAGHFHTPQKIGLPDWARPQLQRGIALRNLGRFREAETVLLEAEHQSEQVAGQESYVTGVTLFFLASSYQAEGRLKQANDLYQKSARVIGKTTGESTSATLEVRSTLAAVTYLASSPPVAHVIADLERAHDDLVRVASDHSPATQLAGYYLAAALCEADQAAKAEELASRLDSRDLATEDASDGWSERLKALQGHILIALGQRAEGEERLRAATATLKQNRIRDPVLQRLEQHGRLVAVAARAGTARAHGSNPQGAPHTRDALVASGPGNDSHKSSR
jgi:non-specific serine/threonine protein kinase